MLKISVSVTPITTHNKAKGLKSEVQYVAIAIAAIGLYIAAYFTLVYYGLIAANTKLMPKVCQLEERTCQTVLTTKYARLFGVPNSLLGVVYYATVILLLSTDWIDAPGGIAILGVWLELWFLVMIAAWFTVLVGFVLVYSLFFIIRIPCPLCLAGHAFNLTLAIIFTFLCADRLLDR